MAYTGYLLVVMFHDGCSPGYKWIKFINTLHPHPHPNSSLLTQKCVNSLKEKPKDGLSR